jgi:hypothetical protein
VQIHVLLTSALVGGEWSASRPCHFIPRERVPGTFWIGSLVDPRAGLGDTELLRFLTLPGSNLDPLIVQPVGSCYNDYTTALLKLLL